MTKKSEVLRRWQLVSPYLHRKQQTVWAAAEAEVIGPSGCLMLANVTGISIPDLNQVDISTQADRNRPRGKSSTSQGMRWLWQKTD